MRFAYTVLLLALFLFAPWWVLFTVGFFGVLFFQWYFEYIFIGLLFDIIFGSGAMTWYGHMTHTILFSIPVVLIEYIRPQLNMYGFSFIKIFKKK